ncbi:MAG: hypothetical protein A2V70_02490 [Planctomycetes bacterium RBG_13_63_9]|nr:MAG: hypothetical protein A2V70_02490 [Planctomycetes bacterium RBG_13_63_9]
MGEAVSFLLYVGTPAVLLILGLVVGSSIEAAHFRRLVVREEALSHIVLSNLKRLPANWDASEGMLVTGEAVVATDYFKVFVAALRNLFGGRIRGYETLVERARREAIVRMLQQAQSIGANVVWCVRLETATIQGKQQGKSGGVEVLAYGTALKVWGKQPKAVQQ